LVKCEAAGVYLTLCRELVVELAELLLSDGQSPVLEVCAGSGCLAAALAASGVRIVATDSQPLPGSDVIAATAGQALAAYQPEAVLGSFVPVDSGIDLTVLQYASVRAYIVLGPRLGGQLGSPGLWSDAAWKFEQLPAVTRWMLTRHDVWLPAADGRCQLLQHGEAWRFCRKSASRKR
jgi:hypothetical protein